MEEFKDSRDQSLHLLCNERTTSFHRRIKAIEDKIDKMPSIDRVSKIEERLENYPTMQYIVEEVLASNKNFIEVIHDISITLEKINHNLTELDKRQVNISDELVDFKHYTKQEIKDIKSKISEVDDKSKIDIIKVRKDSVVEHLKRGFLLASGGGLIYFIIRFIMENM